MKILDYHLFTLNDIDSCKRTVKVLRKIIKLSSIVTKMSEGFDHLIEGLGRVPASEKMVRELKTNEPYYNSTFSASVLIEQLRLELFLV